MKSLCLLFTLILLTPMLRAQEVTFPIPLIPGDRFTIQSQYDGVPVDTLWLLKDSQLRRFIVRSIKQEVDSMRADILTKQVALYRQKTEQMDQIIRLSKEGYEHYKSLWLKTDQQLEEAEIRADRNLKWGFAAGIVVSAALVILIK